jgi:glycosyltransferase involved in cell wall biosynthesis
MALRVLRVYPAANDPRHRRREMALMELGVEVGLVLPERYGSDWIVAPVEPGLRHWRAPLWLPGSIPLHLWRHRVIQRAIREFRPDVVDIHEEPFFAAGAQATRAAGDIPVVMYTAQNLAKRLPPPFPAVQSWVLGRVRGMYPCSEGAAAVVRSRGYGGPLTVVPIGVERELLEAHPHGERVGFVGRLVAEKGVGHLLGFGPRLLCVGDGPLRADVTRAGGEVRRAGSLAELTDALEEMAVLVAPSLSTPAWKEQFGRMAVEAMAAGVPVVAYRSGSLPEVIGEAGILVEEGDATALRRAVESVLRDPGDLAQRGRERVRGLYLWDKVAERMRDLYQAAVA